MDLFFIKKLLGILLMPINIIIILLFAAIILSASHQKLPQKLSKGLLISGFALLLISSLPSVSNYFIKPLETQYKVFKQQPKPLDYIVVLGCGHVSNDTLPVIAQLYTCSLQRLLEAFRLFQLHPEAIIITSGYGGSDKEPNAIKMKKAAIALGIPHEKIRTEPNPKDTAEEALLIAPLLLNKNFALVTNANHMPRAMQYFIQQKTNPIAAPTGFLYQNESNSFLESLPRVSALKQTTTFWYETLGRFVQWLKD